MRDVDEPRARRIGRWLPVLGAGSTGADVAHDSARALPLLACVVQRAGLAIDTGRRRDVDERRGRDHFAGRAIDHVDVPVAIGVHEDLARSARQREIDQEAFVRGVVIEADHLASHLQLAAHGSGFLSARFPHHAGAFARVAERINERLDDSAPVAVVTLRDKRVLDRAT